MSWENVESKVYQRPCDTTELFLKAVSSTGTPHNREHWAINTIARIGPSGSLSGPIVPRLEKAWTVLRFQHPTIAAIWHENTLRYRVPNDEDLAQWLSNSFLIEEDNVDNFLLSIRPKTYASLHYFPKTSEILLRFHHWLIDGIGSLHLLNALLENLAAESPVPLFGDEWRRLAPSFTEVAGFPLIASPESEKVAADMIGGFVSGLPSIGLTLEPELKNMGGTCHRKIQLSGDLTRDILSACKQRHISVASAIHAAVIVSTQKLKTDSQIAKRYTSIATYNYRSQLKAPYNDADKWPMGCWVFNIPFSFPSGDFMTHATSLQRHYHQPLKKDSYFESDDNYV